MWLNTPTRLCCLLTERKELPLCKEKKVQYFCIKPLLFLWRRRRDFRTMPQAALLALLQLRLSLSLALRSLVGKSQVAATRKISLHPPPAAVDFSPSLTATRFEIRISLRQRKKGTPLGGNVALITHLVVKYRAKQALLALLQLQVSSALARRSVEKT